MNGQPPGQPPGPRPQGSPPHQGPPTGPSEGPWQQAPPPQQGWQQAPPPQQGWQQGPAPQQGYPAAAGQPLVFPMHRGARTAYNVVGVLLIVLIITIPFAIWIFVGAARAKITLATSELTVNGFTTKRWSLPAIRRLGVLSVPVLAKGIGGTLARKKCGGENALHLCAIDDRGAKLRFMVSMFERYPEVIHHVAAAVRLPIEELKMGAFGPKWPENS